MRIGQVLRLWKDINFSETFCTIPIQYTVYCL